jgi:hypothetical protein
MNNYNALKNISAESRELHKRLANYFLRIKEGESILSVREFTEVLGASLGSLSYTLNNLEEMGAVRISRRGRLGSFLEQKSLGILWKIIEEGPMVIALTLPSFMKSEGLATAIYSLLDQASIETYLIFIRGSFNRVKALRSARCHAAVMSVLAAEELCNENEEVILKLPAQSFVTDHRVFYRVAQEKSAKPLRVGMDVDSFDLKYLTELEFAQSPVEFHPMTYSETDRNLEKSSVDATISNIDHLEHLISAEISSRPLSARVHSLIGDRDTSAAFLIRSESAPAKIILQEVLAPEAILSIQQKVVDGLMVPRY